MSAFEKMSGEQSFHKLKRSGFKLNCKPFYFNDDWQFPKNVKRNVTYLKAIIRASITRCCPSTQSALFHVILPTLLLILTTRITR